METMAAKEKLGRDAQVSLQDVGCTGAQSKRIEHQERGIEIITTTEQANKDTTMFQHTQFANHPPNGESVAAALSCLCSQSIQGKCCTTTSTTTATILLLLQRHQTFCLTKATTANCCCIMMSTNIPTEDVP